MAKVFVVAFPEELYKYALDILATHTQGGMCPDECGYAAAYFDLMKHAAELDPAQVKASNEPVDVGPSTLVGLGPNGVALEFPTRADITS